MRRIVYGRSGAFHWRHSICGGKSPSASAKSTTHPLAVPVASDFPGFPDNRIIFAK
jgi:hypothetical protein